MQKSEELPELSQPVKLCDPIDFLPLECWSIVVSFLGIQILRHWIRCRLKTTSCCEFFTLKPQAKSVASLLLEECYKPETLAYLDNTGSLSDEAAPNASFPLQAPNLRSVSVYVRDWILMGQAGGIAPSCLLSCSTHIALPLPFQSQLNVQLILYMGKQQLHDHPMTCPSEGWWSTIPLSSWIFPLLWGPVLMQWALFRLNALILQ